MPSIYIRARGVEADPQTALRLITDYERWPAASEAVHSVTVEHEADGASTSFWEVTFHNGLMRWSERDTVDELEGVGTFDLIEGDPKVFTGIWSAESSDMGCTLTMEAEFDLGMPSLGHMLDPIAIDAVEDAVGSVLRGLFGLESQIEYGSRAPATDDRAQPAAMIAQRKRKET